MFPSKVRVMDGLLPALPTELAVLYEEAVSNEDRLTEKLSQFLTLEGIPHKNLRSDMEMAVKTTKHIYTESFDDHPAVAGYQVYADGAYRLLSEHGRLGNEHQARSESN